MSRAFASPGMRAVRKVRRTIARALVSTALWAAVLPAGATPGYPAFAPATAAGIVAVRAFEHVAVPGDSLALLGARAGVSAGRVAGDNGLDLHAPLRIGQRLTITSRHLVPAPLEEGILVNLPQRMLYLFRGGRLVDQAPAALGRPDWRTPVGNFVVVDRQVDKTWFVPPSIQDEMRREGKQVLTRVPPGPDNPLGRHWIGLSLPGIGIHGTIAPATVYGFSSHGCVRLHPEDIARLHRSVAVGDRGRVVYEPVLIMRDGRGAIWFEANPDPYRRGSGSIDTVRAMARERGIEEAEVDWVQVARMLGERDGQAAQVGNWTGVPGPASEQENECEDCF